MLKVSIQVTIFPVHVDNDPQDDAAHDHRCHDYLVNGSVDTPITPGCRRTLRRLATSH